MKVVQSFLFCLVSATMLVSQIVRAEGLKTQLMPLINAHEGQVAVAIKHLDSGESFSYQADKPMPTASLIKFPVMIEAYSQAEQGRIDLDSHVTLGKDDKVPGSGILSEHFSPGVRLSIRDAIRLMIVYSDNTATNLVLDQIGVAAVAERMAALGLPNTKIHAKVFRGDTSVFPDRSRQFGLGSTTANETLRLYELLHEEELISTGASQQMLAHLLRCADDSKLVRFLPPTTRVAHKGGAVSRVRCEAGIIFSPAGAIVVCVFTSQNEDRSWKTDNAGNRLCASIAQVARRYFNRHSGADTEQLPTVLAQGASGRLVEDLQRTLNDRLSPSPELSVDGDFGPMTQAAVRRFQQNRELAVSGEVGQQTWSALGTLVTTDPPVAEPETVNSQHLPRESRDRLDGSPQVTCKAWAIANAATGEVLWSHNAESRLDFASTTKIMTAFVVLRLAQQDPQVLDEQVVFSTRADSTRGSTAAIRAGERLTVRQLLYGLLLPSGNDASVALAEHFGDRLVIDQEEQGDSPADALPRFVAAMNRTAGELGMTNTKYRNPHGLTEKDHLSTAHDLIRLARAAWQLETLRNYVNTRQHGCTLVGPGGYRRNVVWKNTNRLLAITGYQGIKTGTTTAAYPPP